MNLAVTAQEIWKFGTQERAGRGTPLVLFGNVLNAAAGADYTTLRRIRTTAGYQVTAGKTLILTRLIFLVNAAAVAWHLGDGTDDVGIDSAAAPAGLVLWDTDAATKQGTFMGLSANVLYDVECYFEVPASRFAAVGAVDTGSRVRVLLFGVEV